MDSTRGTLRGMIAEGTGDGELLRRFAATRDEAAFEELLRRHGALVFGVCRRRLPQAADAEDALQATFLALARQAAALASRGTVAPWLHCVARRVSGKLRRSGARHRESALPEGLADARSAGDPLLAERLDAELARLPEGERAAALLCGVEGLGRREAARLLGVPEGTLSARLSRAYARLRRRLKHLDPALALGAAALALPATARAAALDVAADGGTDGAGLPAAVVKLAKGAMLMDGMRRLGTWTLGGVAALALGAAGLAAQERAAPKTATVSDVGDVALAGKPVAADPNQLLALQAKLAELEAQRQAAAKQVELLTKASRDALENDPAAIMVHVDAVMRNHQPSSVFEVRVRRGGDRPDTFSVYDIPSLKRLMGWLSKESAKPRFVGLQYRSAGSAEGAKEVPGVLQQAGFAVVRLEPAARLEAADFDDRRDALDLGRANPAYGIAPTVPGPSQFAEPLPAPTRQPTVNPSELAPRLVDDEVRPAEPGIRSPRRTALPNAPATAPKAKPPSKNERALEPTLDPV